MERTQARAVRARWLDVTLLGFAAYAVSVGIAAFGNACSWLAKLPPWSFVPLIVIVAAFALRSRGSVTAWLGLRHLPLYPPPWMAAFVAVLLLTAHALAVDTSSPGFGCPFEVRGVRAIPRVALVTAAFVFLSAAGWLAARWWASFRDARARAKMLGASEPDDSAPDTGVLGSDFDALTSWLATDAPVSDPRDDAFERNSIAKRLARRLTGNDRPTVALVGAMGSGKTSIALLVERELFRQRLAPSSIAIKRVSVWSYETVEAALRGILTALDEVLAAHVNTTPLAGLSSEYAAAVESIAGRFGLARDVLRPPRSPESILRVYDRVALAIGLRVVLWIEDLERFSGTLLGARRSQVDSVAPVRALLTQLSECASLQVVVAVTGTTGRFDLEKLARYVEPLPPLAEEAVLRVLRNFRGECIREHPDIDPADPKARERFWPPGDAAERVRAFRRFGAISEDRALALACAGPRILKQGLRACLDAWRVLHGEIDFDDLLVLCLIRAAEPEVFAAISEFIRDLRVGASREHRQGGQDSSPFAERLNVVLRRHSETNRLVVEKLIGTVFPGWKRGTGSETTFKPQGIGQEHTDYWQRYISLARPPDAKSDQRTLRAVQAWSDRGDTTFVRMLLDDDCADVFLPVAPIVLRSDAILRLVEQVVEAEIRRTPRVWLDHRPPGVRGVWLIVNKASIDENDAFPVIGELIRKSLPVNLGIALSVLYFFATREGTYVPLVHTPDLVRSLTDEFDSLVLSTFEHDPAALVRSLRDTPFPILAWSTARLSGRLPDGAAPHPGWNRLSAALLSAADLAPEVVLPQITLIVVDQQMRLGRPDREPPSDAYIFNRERAARLFDLDRLLQLFRAHADVPVSEDAMPFFDAVVRSAKESGS